MKSWSMADIKDHADTAETWPGSGVLNWGEIGWEALAAWVMLSVEIGGDAALPDCDVESVKGCFERWWRSAAWLAIPNRKENAMGDDICWLVTVMYGETLIRCALKAKREDLPGDCAEYPMEPENRRAIHALLPLHVQTCGPVVDVQNLFDVHIANAGAVPRRSDVGTSPLLGVNGEER